MVNRDGSALSGIQATLRPTHGHTCASLRTRDGEGEDGADAGVSHLAVGGKAIKCPSPLNVLKDTYDCIC